MEIIDNLDKAVFMLFEIKHLIQVGFGENENRGIGDSTYEDTICKGEQSVGVVTGRGSRA